jgi:hypothetical protein
MNWDTDSILGAAETRLLKEAADARRRARKKSLPTKHQRRAAFDIVARRTAGVLRLQIAKEKLPDGEYIYTVVAQGTGYGRIADQRFLGVRSLALSTSIVLTQF